MKSELQLLEECIENKHKQILEIQCAQARIRQQPAQRSSFGMQIDTAVGLDLRLVELEQELHVLNQKRATMCSKLQEDVAQGTKQEVLDALDQLEDGTYKLVRIRKSDGRTTT